MNIHAVHVYILYIIIISQKSREGENKGTIS